MDPILSVVLWPLYYVLDTVCVIVGLVLVVLPGLLIGAVSYGPRIKKTAIIWNALEGWPGGRYMFSKLVGFFAPYTGSIDALVTHVEPGVCEACMTDRPWKRNPFASVHAVAIANLAEMTAGMAGVTALEAARGARGIPVAMSVEYIAKARGTLYCRAAVPAALPSADSPAEKDMDIVCDVSDASGKVVAAVTVAWKFSMSTRKPKKAGGSKSKTK